MGQVYKFVMHKTIKTIGTIIIEAILYIVCPSSSTHFDSSPKPRHNVNLDSYLQSQKRVAITVFSFPPDKGKVGTTSYHNVFSSIFFVLQDLKRDCYNVTVLSVTSQMSTITQLIILQKPPLPREEVTPIP